MFVYVLQSSCMCALEQAWFLFRPTLVIMVTDLRGDMMNKHQRQEAILGILRDSEFASVRELAENFAVSLMTIRRDLSVLESAELVRAVHGGAVLNKIQEEGLPRTDLEYSFSVQSRERQREKSLIGARAAQLISEGDVIIVDSGTTTEALVRAIPAELSITLVCYAANIFDIGRHRRNWRLILAGGHFHSGDLMFESNEGLVLIENTRATKAFLAAGGVSDRLGLTCVNRYETETKKAAIRSSLSVLLLADSSKFGIVTPSHFAELGDIDTVITDDGISQEYRRIMRDAGVECLIASSGYHDWTASHSV